MSVSVGVVVYGERNSVEFTVRNVAEDEEAITELERMGTMTTPVTGIGSEAGEEKEVVVVGFDRARLGQVLGL